ncbi:zinc-ribbon domain-containing protein [Candidatus Nitrososphaera sp. FF02]
MSTEKPVGMQKDGSLKYCVECGAKVPRAQKTCPACGETQ